MFPLPRRFGAIRTVRGRAAGLIILLTAANLAAWAWALVAFRDQPSLLATAVLAYVFGLRHAVDADHIAAIDNVTRKLMQDGQRPVGVGFFFSIGHTLVLAAATVGIATTAVALKDRLAGLHDMADLVGTGVSALFLLAIAAMNLMIARAIHRSFRDVRAGRASGEDAGQIHGHGPLTRLFRPLFRLIGKSWHMLPLGALFGLAFETATEAALFGTAVAQATGGQPFWFVLLFPALFAAGMALIDTADGILMLGVYGWAFMRPLRKLYYNLTITLISALVALAVGGIEVLGLVYDRLHPAGWFWEAVGRVNDHFSALGYAVIAIFAGSWLVAAAVYRLRGYDSLEPAPPAP